MTTSHSVATKFNCVVCLCECEYEILLKLISKHLKMVNIHHECFRSWWQKVSTSRAAPSGISFAINEDCACLASLSAWWSHWLTGSRQVPVSWHATWSPCWEKQNLFEWHCSIKVALIAVALSLSTELDHSCMVQPVRWTFQSCRS